MQLTFQISIVVLFFALPYNVFAFTELWNSDMGAEIERLAQPIVDELTEKYNTSCSFSLYHESFQVNVAAGIDNHATGKKLSKTSKFPSGSETKTITAVSIMQLAEAGKIDLDIPASNYLDEILQKHMGKNFVELFQNDERVANITTRHLLHMQAGINDYDNNQVVIWTLTHPNDDYTVWDYLKAVNKTLMFTPGEGQAYSSIAYMLLGLELVHVTGGSDWTDFDQRSAFLNYTFDGTIFPRRGPCSKYTDKENMVEQYLVYPKKDWFRPKYKLNINDITKDSCLNGWTCGNVAWTTSDAAKFFYLIATSKLVSSSSLKEMVSMKPMTTGWSTGLPYGLGLMAYPYAAAVPNTGNDLFNTQVGHGGEDYGSQGAAGWNAGLGIGTALAVNSVMGMNTSMADVRVNYLMQSDLMCNLMSASYSVIKKYSPKAPIPQLNCSSAWRPTTMLRTLK